MWMSQGEGMMRGVNLPGGRVVGEGPQEDILIIEDERDLARLMEVNLRAARYGVRCAYSGEEGLALARAQRPALILLDLMLPDIPGQEVCRRLWSSPGLREVPVVMVTARDDEVDRVVGFELGAADYVVKPFSVRELVLRVEAILRRVQRQRVGEALTLGGLTLDPVAHRVEVNGEEIPLTPSEFSLLKALLEGEGCVYRREDLLNEVWGGDVHVLERTVDAHMMRLRRKLGEAAALVETVRGVGYRLALPNKQTPASTSPR
jgi:two-component system phosphate regulon response regulator PhoB